MEVKKALNKSCYLKQLSPLRLKLLLSNSTILKKPMPIPNITFVNHSLFNQTVINKRLMLFCNSLVNFHLLKFSSDILPNTQPMFSSKLSYASLPEDKRGRKNHYKY